MSSTVRVNAWSPARRWTAGLSSPSLTEPMLANRSIPRCIVIPELAYPDIGKAMDWLGDAFGFTLRLRIADHRAQLNVGDGAVVLTELAEGRRVDVGHSVMVRVENVDRHCEQASRHGAKIIRGPADYP